MIGDDVEREIVPVVARVMKTAVKNIKKQKPPDDDTLSITTMCGHHMIPPKFVKHVMEQVEKGRLTPEEGALKLANFCYCGIFNHVRCAEIIKKNVIK